MKRDRSPSDLLQGTPDMLILETVALEPCHAYGIGNRIAQISNGTFQVNAGSLFPGLRRLARDGLIRGQWQITDNNRRAKLYSLARSGRTALDRQTRDWNAQSAAIGAILEAQPEHL